MIINRNLWEEIVVDNFAGGNRENGTAGVGSEKGGKNG